MAIAGDVAHAAVAAVGAAGCIALLASCSGPGEAVRSGPLGVKETCQEIGRLMSVSLEVGNQVLDGDLETSREFAAPFDALSQRCDDARARIEFNLSHGG